MQDFKPLDPGRVNAIDPVEVKLVQGLQLHRGSTGECCRQGPRSRQTAIGMLNVVCFPLRLTKTYRSPPVGSWGKAVRATAYRPSKDLRISTAWPYR
jgi:hypothetical protein